MSISQLQYKRHENTDHIKSSPIMVLITKLKQKCHVKYRQCVRYNNICCYALDGNLYVTIQKQTV